MPALPIATPQAIGFDPVRVRRAFDMLKRWASEDKLPAAGLCVGRRGRMIEPLLVGRQRPGNDSPPLRPDALFLVASITKPVTVAAAMMLVERGEIALEDPVGRFVPKFTGGMRDDVQIRHLMTHTSGLPDQLPDNFELRKAHKPLSAFVEGACTTPLLFKPGTKVSYQSMGMLLLAEVVHQVSGTALPDFLRKEIFAPLGMNDT